LGIRTSVGQLERSDIMGEERPSPKPPASQGWPRASWNTSALDVKNTERQSN